MRVLVLSFWAILVGIGLIACGQEPPEKLVESARAYLAKNEPRSAIIQLKNALQRSPSLPEARFLLGKTLLETGDAVAAAVELRKASELKYPADKVVPELARALFASGEFRRVIELDGNDAGLHAAASVADFKTSVARAQLQAGDASKADAAVNAALQADPEYAPALLIRARSQMSRKEYEAALKIVDSVLARVPKDPDALVVKGDLLRLHRNDVAGAVSLYREALAAQPDHVLAFTALLEQLLVQSDLDGARKEIEAMKKLRPGHPQVVYFQARLALDSGDLKAAEDLAQQLLKLAPDDPNVLQLAGVVALQQGQLLVAQNRLSKLVQQLPNAVVPRRLLARAYLRSGDADKTMEAVSPLLQAAAPDADALALAAGASLLSGDVGKAQTLYGRVAGADSDAVHARTGSAVSRIVSGNGDQGLRDLQSLAANDRSIDTDMTLISALTSRRDYDMALRAVDHLEQKAQGKPIAPHLRGQLLLLKGDLAGARRAYEQALARDPGFFPAIDRLAALDWREKKPEAARARFEAALKANPQEARAWVGLAHVDEQAGRPRQEVAASLSKAVALKPTDGWLRSQLIRYHLGKGDYPLALSAAQSAATAMPNDPDMLELLGVSQLAAGEINQAISSYTALTSLRPKSPLPLLGLADAYIASKSYEQAADAVKKAAALAPGSTAVLQQGARVDMLSGRSDRALAQIRAVQARSPGSAQAFAVEGDLEFARRNWAGATTAYRAALRREPASTSLAQRVYMSLRASGDKAKAEAFAGEWEAAQPSDGRFAFFLANLYIADRNYDRAEAELGKVLRVDPENAMALNNLAWVQWTRKKPGALDNAERAHQLAPNQPVILDTLASVLADQGQLPRALQLQQHAVELNPSAPAFRLTLARLYVQAGDKPAARKQLDALAQLGDKFPQQAEVKSLMERL